MLETGQTPPLSIVSVGRQNPAATGREIRGEDGHGESREFLGALLSRASQVLTVRAYNIATQLLGAWNLIATAEENGEE
ncbi:hypothetical protein SDJN03_18187, partial [Cucurbita argyrosperma subsp. sororia]